MVVLASGASAQSSLGHHNGVYLYSHGANDEAEILHAIEAATEDLNFMQRGIARKRLEDSTQPFPSFHVLFEGERVLLRIDHHEFDLPLDGRGAKLEGLNGDEAMVSATLRGDDLHQVFRGDRGTRYLEYRFHDNGIVFVETTIESKYLPHKIAYSLRYHRSQ